MLSKHIFALQAISLAKNRTVKMHIALIANLMNERARLVWHVSRSLG